MQTAAAANAIGHNSPPTDAEILQSSLADKHEKLLGSAAKLLDAADRIPSVIENDEGAGKVSDYIKLVMGAKKNLEAERVNEKEPYLTLGRVVDGFFKKTTYLLDGAKAKAQRPLDAWLRQKAAEESARRRAEAEKLRQDAEAAAEAAAALERAKMQPEANKAFEQAQITEQAAAKVEASAMVKPAELSRSRSDAGAVASLRTVWVGELLDVGALDLETLRHHINPVDLQKAVNSFVRAGGRELAGVKIFERSEAVVR